MFNIMEGGGSILHCIHSQESSGSSRTRVSRAGS